MPLFETPGAHQRMGPQNLGALFAVAVHPYIKGQVYCDGLQGKKTGRRPLLERRREVLR